MSTTKSNRATKHGHFRALPKGPTGGVQLLLIQSVDHLGKQGDVVAVKRGYALNYLLPQGLATVATDHHKRMVDKHKARLHEIEKARLASLRASWPTRSPSRASRSRPTPTKRATSTAASTPTKSPPPSRRAGFHITTDQVRLEGPLKELGLYTVKIHLHAEIEAELKVWVVPTVTGDEKPVEKAEKPVADKAAKPEGEKAAKK